MQTLVNHQLFAKPSKCYFMFSKVNYLNHIISEAVEVDLDKFQAIMKWLIPHFVIDIHTYLFLICYYSRFAHNYVSIVSPITGPLKTSKFEFTTTPQQISTQVKIVMSSLLVLVLMNFAMVFGVTK